ncbi:serine protease grass [Drosophila eugracilis]|uniref:serine protease grass n=1 Tax=Drosophila eugracilis TaxID=29029 RepID=UPI0007E8613A|nr:serine protease grass [Drosophila eugracilis]
MKTFPAWICIVLCLTFQETAVFAYFLNPTCGVSYESNLSTRIMRGSTAIIKSAPYMAYLYVSNKLTCGGSIISQRYILTATHCIEPKIKVRLGEHDVSTKSDCQGASCSPPAEEFDVERAIRNKMYGRTLTNDIAMLKLTRNIVFKEHIQPICLLLNPAHSPNVNQYQAFGWGRTERGRVSNVLQTTTLIHYASSYCQNILSLPLTQNQICAGSPNTDTCHGDSGGPLVVKVNYDGITRNLQLGVVSYGELLCRNPGVYTFVPNYISWIQNVMQTYGH